MKILRNSRKNISSNFSKCCELVYSIIFFINKRICKMKLWSMDRDLETTSGCVYPIFLHDVRGLQFDLFFCQRQSSFFFSLSQVQSVRILLLHRGAFIVFLLILFVPYLLFISFCLFQHLVAISSRARWSFTLC